LVTKAIFAFVPAGTVFGATAGALLEEPLEPEPVLEVLLFWVAQPASISMIAPDANKEIDFKE
jgi:hypothetical protein